MGTAQTCLRKQTFRNKRSAKRHARMRGQRVYRCEHCRYWHLTSNRLSMSKKGKLPSYELPEERSMPEVLYKR